MSLPDEKTRAVFQARKFLCDLLDPKKTPKVPKAIREEAYYRLKHYPNALDLLRAQDDYEQVFDLETIQKELDIKKEE